MTPRRYSATGSITAAATKTILGLTGGTTIRTSVYDLVLSNFATPADNAAQWQLRRSTVAATGGTALTPPALDSADPAAVTAVQVAPSAEPTYTASMTLLDVAVNQRATFRWVAAPGSEFITPATSANGIGCQCVAVNAGVGSADATILFME
jgi:hypothetical protein